MKRARLYILLTAALFAVCACEGEPGIPGRDGKDGRDGRDGRDGATLLQPILIDVPAANWAYTESDEGDFFVATVEVPELTEDIFDFGLVKMYRTYDYDTPNAWQIEMPYVRHLREEYGGSVINYTETVDYEFGIGTICIYYTVSDFYYDLEDMSIPGDMYFRCVLML